MTIENSSSAETVTDGSEALFSDQSAEQSQETAGKQDAPQVDALSKIEDSVLHARQKYKLQKENAELKRKLKGASFIDTESENPFKAVKKIKNWSADDILSKALEAMQDDGETPEDAKKQLSEMTKEEILQIVKDDLRKEQEEASKKTESEKAISEFKDEIKKVSLALESAHPLVVGLGAHDQVFEKIESDFLEKEAKYGAEFAQKKMMSIEDAVKFVNNSLAESVKVALKSKHVRSFLSKHLSMSSYDEEGGDQSQDFHQSFGEDSESQTLTSSVHRKMTDQRQDNSLDDDQLLERAFSYLG